MTTKELITLLEKYPEDTNIGFTVEYTDHSNCGRWYGDRCYCESENHELTEIQLRHQESFSVADGKKTKYLSKLWICGE